jgi:hypothetical protein
MVMPALFGGFGNTEINTRLGGYILINAGSLGSQRHWGRRPLNCMRFLWHCVQSLWQQLLYSTFIKYSIAGIVAENPANTNKPIEATTAPASCVGDSAGLIKGQQKQSDSITAEYAKGFAQAKQEHNEKYVPDSLLNSYLAGLIEGDGSIIVPLVKRNAANKLQYPCIKIAFHKNDVPLLKVIQQKLGGRVETLPNYSVLIFNKMDSIYHIATLINGYFRTPKIEALHRLILYLNDTKRYTALEIKPLDLSDLNTNAWLSGYADADGNFNVQIVKRESGLPRIQLSFNIESKQLSSKDTTIEQGGASFFNICNKIATFFEVNLYSRTRTIDNKTFQAYYIRAYSIKSHKIVYSYFEQYPLFSSKYLNYRDWVIIHQMQATRKVNKRLTEAELLLCNKIKANFNTSRTQFNWDHLKDFYK